MIANRRVHGVLASPVGAFVGGQFASMVGDQAAYLALVWWVVASRQSASLLGGVIAGETLPQACFFLVGGWLADRFGALRCIIGADLVRLAAALTIAGLAFSGNMSPVYLIPSTAVLGAAGGVYFPAANAAIPQIAGARLRSANQLMVLAERLTVVVGPLLGTLLARRAGIGMMYAFDGMTFGLSIASAAYVQRISRAPHYGYTTNVWQPHTSVASSLRNRTILILLFLSLVVAGGFNGVLSIGVPLYVHYIHGGIGLLGAATAAFGVGAVIGAVLHQALPYPKWTPVALVSTSFCVIGLSFVAISRSDSLTVLMAGLLGAGFFSAVETIWYRTALQSATSIQATGRISSLSLMASMGGGALWQLGLGFLAAVFAPPTILLGVGVVIVLGSALSTLVTIESRRAIGPIVDGDQPCNRSD